MPTFYLNADTGSDANTGGISDPWLTISKAHTDASSDDTIICQDSTATFSFVAQTFTKNLTITGEQVNSSGAVFDGGGLVFSWQMSTSTSVIFKNITFQNAENTNNIAFFNISTGVNNAEFEFENCIFDEFELAIGGNNTAMFGSGASSGSDGLFKLTNCLISNTKSVSGNPFIMGIRIATNPVFILTGVTFSNVNTGSSSPIGFFDRGASVNNLTFIVKNSIFSSDGDSMSFYTGTTAETESVTNSCYNNFTSTISGSGNITADPFFVDVPNSNFHLRPVSPCIDAGIIL